jgi:hypothetical protein
MRRQRDAPGFNEFIPVSIHGPNIKKMDRICSQTKKVDARGDEGKLENPAI